MLSSGGSPFRAASDILAVAGGSICSGPGKDVEETERLSVAVETDRHSTNRISVYSAWRQVHSTLGFASTFPPSPASRGVVPRKGNQRCLESSDRVPIPRCRPGRWFALERLYPQAVCALVHKNPYQLLVATILSAQCTDTRVNQVTPALFERFPDLDSMAAGDQKDLEELIRSTGFFRAKARSLKTMSRHLVDQYQGEIPRDLDTLTKLAGVGRKTANVVLGTAFGIATGVVVDTHVKRLARRLGLTTHTQPAQIERDLMAAVPRSEWVNLSHRLIYHGRQVCVARKPRCSRCALEKVCPKIGVTTSA